MTDHEVADGTDEETGPDTDTDAEEAPAETTDAEADASVDAGPVDGKDRLEALQEDIDEVRRRVADPTDHGENTFIEKGEAGEDQPVDDTIAPPG